MITIQTLIKKLSKDKQHDAYTLLKRLPLLPTGKANMKGVYSYKLTDILHTLKMKKCRSKNSKELTKELIIIANKILEET